MSNTADVTPYESDYADAGAGNTIAAAAIAAGIADFLSTSEADRASDAARAERLRHERLQVNRITLRGTDPTGLIDAARSLGYAHIAAANRPTSNTPPKVDLRDAAGRRLRIEVLDNRIELYGLTGRAELEAVVRERTVAASMRHLKQIAHMNVVPKRLANGEVELTATETQSKGSAPAASLTVRVARDGVAHVDIENVRGNRCEGMLARYAGDIGGQTRNKKLKPAYYQAGPGEPTKVGVKG